MKQTEVQYQLIKLSISLEYSVLIKGKSIILGAHFHSLNLNLSANTKKHFEIIS